VCASFTGPCRVPDLHLPGTFLRYLSRSRFPWRWISEDSSSPSLRWPHIHSVHEVEKKVTSTTVTYELTLNTSTNTNTSGLPKSTVCPCGTQPAIAWIRVGLLKVVWLRIRASILYLWHSLRHRPELWLVGRGLTRNFCNGSWTSKKDSNMRWHSDSISKIFAAHEPDTGIKRWVYLELDAETHDRQSCAVNVDDDAYLVRVMPECFTFCTCVVTSFTGSTGGLHEMKTTKVYEISC
jgi:hypothetical protein